MKSTSFALALGASAMLSGAAAAADLGAVDTPIKLAVNEWTGQHVTTHIAGEMLKAAGYKVEYVSAGMMNQFQAIADGDIHATLEIWSSNVSDEYAKKVAEGTVEELGDLELDAKEGIAYPAHVAELCPGLPAWEALKACAPQFATAETLPQGRLVDYPADWGTPGADRMAGLDLPFKAVPAGSEAALIVELRAATERKTPLLITFWQPHWAMSAYDVKFVDLPEGEEACFTDPAWGPNPNAVNDCDFAPSRIFKAGWSGLAETWPAAHEILSSYTLAVEDQQPMMGAIDVDGGSVEEVVADWMAANEGKWRPVVDAALK
ncbi:ABC transporter substrate-binding protein [Phaeobacter gallaeciensis]|uniref:ABC transporter substrate-binding protein n=1 Tax=Phaeobacter gallaeciensis TaxID=60890 RepID=UPI00237FBCBD|nr:ABC transporter substrate-binding protein [Phaeobacter gallaeciensis]MDE4061347.1 ABC transporter substrate-binding protein [Phaeobacter gallaeciensis]MDE4124458.1 ABC transporter substrate-binding protein [Phaeobacter gallaeciensis]MDE4128776.1 ABC transporter substrate-binding protein [Phaeobacter gallaeciensis]